MRYYVNFRPRGGTEKILVTIMSRERAPLAAYQDMFVNNTAASSKGNNFRQSVSFEVVFRVGF